MSSPTSPTSTTFSTIVDAASSIYVLVLEPVLTVAYVWLMWRIGRYLTFFGSWQIKVFRSRIKELHSSFYSFFIFTGKLLILVFIILKYAGIAACLNELVVMSKRPGERYMPNSWIKGNSRLLRML